MGIDSIFATALPTILCTGILALVGCLWKAVKAIGDEVKANNRATFVMLQDRILQSCKFHQARGCIPPHDAEMLQSLFDQYTAMHGNGYVKKQVEATLLLPQE